MKTKILAIGLITLLGACSPKVPLTNANVNLLVEQSHQVLKPGESVTFTAHASGTAGRSEKIKWEAKGGDLENLNGMDRYARVQYDKPGTYVVSSSLLVDGVLVDQEVSTVRVEPLG